jgi:hypothetical protein
MKTVMTSLIALLLATLSMTTAKAASFVYLPMVTNQANPTAADPNATFRLENLRLWHATQNHGKVGAPFTCGDLHKVEVHVFDGRGDQGEQARLNGIIVKVVRWENGQRFEELHTTGLPGATRGVVEFELKQLAEVSILTDTDGRLVSSHAVQVTTLPNKISVEQLIQGGYCQNDASCQAFVNTNRCAGAFSWNVVFKRSY